MTGVAKMVDYGMSDEEIEETLGSQMTEQLFLSPEFEALEKRVETLEKKHQELIENLRIFMVNDEEEFKND